VTQPTIEDIVLAHDTRHMSVLRPYVPERFVSDAAVSVLEHPGPALIVTGFYIARAGAPETDGPPGAVALGRALGTLGFDVAYVTDRFSRAAVEALAGSSPIIDFPVAGHEESARLARELLEARRPSVLFAIERPGLVADGTYRNYQNADFSAFNAKTDYLFNRHPMSVGIGDGGNEIGMGNLRDIMRRLEGLPPDPSVTTTSKLIIASCSNWGAYGLVAALSQLTARNLLPSVRQGREWVDRIVEVGAVDGLSGERKNWVDGRSPDEDDCCLRALHELLARTLPAPPIETSRGGAT
jgi:D-glutamate cyclase-like, C-terminal